MAQTFGRQHVRAGRRDRSITAMEHHSNIVPWQMLCEEKGARLRVVPINDAGELRLEEFDELLTPQHAAGRRDPRLERARHGQPGAARSSPWPTPRRARCWSTGPRRSPHLQVDVQELDCDFYAFSGHKMYGPTGIGVLYGKAELLEAMPPYQGGGDMISSVTFEKTTYNDLPYKFEAGTPNIAGAIGLGAAIDYVNGGPRGRSPPTSMSCSSYATERLSSGCPGCG